MCDVRLPLDKPAMGHCVLLKDQPFYGSSSQVSRYPLQFFPENFETRARENHGEYINAGDRFEDGEPAHGAHCSAGRHGHVAANNSGA